MAINPILAIIELTKQHKEEDYSKFSEVFFELIGGVYGIEDYSPDWLKAVYELVMKAQVSLHSSIVLTLRKVYALCSLSEKIENHKIIESCSELSDWLRSNHTELQFIGGPLLYASVYAIAGSPDAKLLLKVNKALKGDCNEVASNVAWDFLYWILMEMEFHRNDYENAILCTADRSLSIIASSRVNLGPRSGLSSKSKPGNIDSYGFIEPYKFKRLENTSLEANLKEVFASLFLYLSQHEEQSFKFGFNQNA